MLYAVYESMLQYILVLYYDKNLDLSASGARTWLLCCHVDCILVGTGSKFGKIQHIAFLGMFMLASGDICYPCEIMKSHPSLVVLVYGCIFDGNQRMWILITINFHIRGSILLWSQILINFDDSCKLRQNCVSLMWVMYMYRSIKLFWIIISYQGLIL